MRHCQKGTVARRDILSFRLVLRAARHNVPDFMICGRGMGGHGERFSHNHIAFSDGLDKLGGTRASRPAPQVSAS